MLSQTRVNPSSRIYIQEVVTRDGFQAEPRFIPTEEKIRLINRLSRSL
ncbi:MAG: HMGL-like [Pseudomonadota bacterium]